MDSTLLIIFIIILMFGNIYQATRPARIQVVEVPVEKPQKRRRRKKVVDFDPVDLDAELDRLIRGIERKSGLVTSLRTIYLLAGTRRVEVWDDPVTGKFGFNFQDVLEYQRALEAANHFEQELQAQQPALLPEETQQ